MNSSVDEGTSIDNEGLLFRIQLPLGFYGGALWGALLESIWLTIDWRLIILGNFLGGCAVQALWILLVIHRYGNPLNDPELRKLIDAARNRMDISFEPDVWVRDSNKYFLTKGASVNFAAIFLSPPAAQAIKKQPDYGEVVLADELEQLRRFPKYHLLWISVLTFTFISSIFILHTSILSFIIEFWGLSIIPLLLVGVMGLIAVSMLTIIIRLSAGNERPESGTEKRVREEYGIEPSLARMKVFSDLTADQASLQLLIGKSSEWERKDKLDLKKMLRIPLLFGAIYVFIPLILNLLVFTIFESSFILKAANSFVIVLSAAVLIVGFAIVFGFVGSEARDENDFPEVGRDSLCTSLQNRLNSINGYENYTVRLAQPDIGDPYIVIGKPDIHQIDSIEMTINSSVLEVLDSPEHLLPYVLSEMRYQEYNEQELLITYWTMGASLLVFIGYAILNSFTLGGFNLRLLLQNILSLSFQIVPLLLWVVIMLGVLVPTFILFRFRKKSIDSEIAEEYPQWRQGLRQLRDAGLMIGRRTPSFVKRLNQLQSP